MESMKEQALSETAGSSGDIRKAISVAGTILISLALSIFFFSPLIQLVVRFVGRSKISRHQYPDLIRYESAIDTTNRIVNFAAIILYIGIVCYAVHKRLNRKYNSTGSRDALLSKDMIRRLVPFFLFVLFAAGILVGTVIRGTNDWDMTGHWYMHESIFSFIIYALAYFFCGMMVFGDRAKKILLYLLIGSALPMHILALINEWGTHIVYFEAQGLSTGGVTAVFFNSNHYGYYLVITLLTSALLFVYEKRKELRIVSAVSGITATMVLIINNTLGAYLAVLFVLVLFLIYCLVMDKQNRINAVIILAAFLAITVLMSFRYNTIVSSFLVLSNDIGQIVENPLEADSAGSSRWMLWKGTVLHLAEHPVLGFGVEGLLSLYGIGTPHNEFLQYAAFFGLPVMVLYIAACAVVLWRVFRNSKNMSPGTMICFFVSIGYLASSFFGVTIFYTTPFFYIFLGLTYAEYLRNGKQVLQNVEQMAEEQQAEEQPAKSLYEQGMEAGRAEGRREGGSLKLISMVCRKLQKEKKPEDIAAELEEELSLIERICEAAGETAPEYDIDAIYQALQNENIL